MELEATGLELGSTSRKLLRSIETDVVFPIRDVVGTLHTESAAIIGLLGSLCTSDTDACTRELNTTVNRIRIGAANTCVGVSTAIRHHSDQATTLGCVRPRAVAGRLACPFADNPTTAGSRCSRLDTTS